ncbi:MAG: peptidylprolyl isomerase [Polyangiaceae bacterium]
MSIKPFLASLLVLGLFGCQSEKAPEPENRGAPSPRLPAATAVPTAAAAAAAAVVGPDKAKEQAPAKYKAKFTTSKGDFVLEVTRDWAPGGADRFYNLIKIGFFDDTRFFRVVPGFVVQWGIHAQGEPVMSQWRNANIPDDPVKESNKAGTIVFATSGPNSRSTQVFINFEDNARLDAMGFAPFGKVVEGMDVVKKITAEYGQRAQQPLIQSQGNAYLNRDFPNMDYIKKATIVP